MRLNLTCALVAAAFSTVAHASPIQPFTAGAFATAQAQGQPIVVDVFAPWCPTCRAQAPIIDRLVDDPKNAATVVLRMDFDTQKAAERALGVRMQSTLIAFHGHQERNRVIGSTDPKALAALFAAAW